ncbi:MAG: ATP-dependent DNA helicase [Pseudacidovorax sp.]|uniref:ATP-dependent DNA helicase n=1 Tax=Pseudacidovorax sp. TaxID=1934311 RepID=UPI001B6D55F9|nr:ATP-dependent DNA helicase [Pseudacidovorax sp.]MBP6897519.1 ATP-dependent DNA helicase [Pseudacidovorax sp.]
MSRVSVKSLCAFAAKAGDLDIRFVPAPTAHEGQAGHSLVQSRRGPGYEREVALETVVDGLQVRGRADGYDAGQRRVEEIKTFRGDFARIKGNHRALHWAQAKTYAALLCERDALTSITVALVYLDLASGEETVLQEHCEATALKAALQAMCEAYARWAQQEEAHRAQRDAQMAQLAFPHGDFRAGQHKLSRDVYRAAACRRCLIAQAPTGIGKTLATTYPLLRGMAAHGTDKVFFLTAKTPGRQVALDALRQLGDDRALRVLELSARESACERPGAACHGDSCPLAKGFYNRLPAARAEAAEARWLDREALRRIAAGHGVCPYFLGQEMVRWSDVVVGDYNYYFDGTAMLHALAREEEWQVAVLVDEAHNLVDRARAMYSTTLAFTLLDGGEAAAPAFVQAALRRVRREWRQVSRAQTVPYAAATDLPEPLVRSLADAVAALSEHAAQSSPELPGPLQALFFGLLALVRLADVFGPHSVFEVTNTPQGEPLTLAIRNLVPAGFLRPRFAGASTAVLFSGTIAPFGYYRDLLGLPEDTVELEVDSPFRAEQLRVEVARDVSTRLRDRPRSLPRITAVMARQFAQRPGNYIAFFSSFAYLDMAFEAFARQHPGVPVWRQSSGMPERERTAFVARFAPGGQGIAFAVLGGAFAEGVDLPGDRLVGAFVASLGLPQHDEANEVLRERMEAMFGQGYAYTYLYPGLRKVVQAAGRVVRTEQDTGVVHLLDDRFAQPEVLALLPRWWTVTSGTAP